MTPSSQHKLVSVVGARPQFVKAAVVGQELRAVGVEEVMIHTGQHYDDNMSKVFFTELEIAPPRYNLGIGGGSHGDMTGRQLMAIERCLIEEAPAAVMVYGDTNSTLAGALAAVKLHIPVMHVEAGLRSFNERMPEEINRIVTDRVSSVLFAPSKLACANLLAEGVDPARIIEVGDVMYDAALRYAPAAPLRAAERRCAVVTIHRAENTDDSNRLGAMVDALVQLSNEMDLTFPVHPRTREALQSKGLWARLSAAADIIEPLGYVAMLGAIKRSDVVITDSGGVQKEAYFLGTPCVTLRLETEWTETVELGWNQLVPEFTAQAIAACVAAAKRPTPSSQLPYGDGHAARRIAEHLRSVL